MNWPTLFDPLISGRLCLALLHSVWQMALLVLIAGSSIDFAVNLRLSGITRATSWRWCLGSAAVPLTYSVVQVPKPGAAPSQSSVAAVAHSALPVTTVPTTDKASSPAAYDSGGWRRGLPDAATREPARTACKAQPVAEILGFAWRRGWLAPISLASS